MKVSETALSELQKHNVGAWGAWKEKGGDERIPTLSDVLKEVPPDKRVVIEIKCHEEVLPALAQTFTQTKLKPGQLPIITFHHEVAEAAKKKCPRHEVFWLHGWSKEKQNPTVEQLIQKANDAGLDGLNLNYGFPINKEFVARVHAAGLKLYTWTVNDAAVGRALRDAGVDGITTDRPAWLREELTK